MIYSRTPHVMQIKNLLPSYLGLAFSLILQGCNDNDEIPKIEVEPRENVEDASNHGIENKMTEDELKDRIRRDFERLKDVN